MRTRFALSAVDVQKILAACREEALKNNWNVSIAVTDDVGYLLGLTRLDGASPSSAEVAHRKARGAALTGRPSKFWEDRLKERVGFLNFPDDESLTVQGGVPLIHQGQCVGAIGVSGVQSHEDEQVANAGATTIA